jgi:hypothetical protein
MVKATFPEHQWDGWRFQIVDDHYWKHLGHQKQFLDFVYSTENFTSMDDWYNITKTRLAELGGGSLVNDYKSSIATMLMTVFPNHHWLPWKFGTVPRGHWSKIENRQRFFRWVGETLGHDPTNLEIFYSITHSDLVKAAGTGGVLEKYNRNVPKALMATFPEHAWKEWRFGQVPRRFWLDPANVRRFCDDLLLSHGLGIDQRHLITDDEIRAHGGGSMLARFYDGSRSNLFAAAYPEHR